MPVSAIIVEVLLLAILLISLFREDHKFLYMVGLLLPLNTLDFFFGVQFNWFKIIFPLTIVGVLVKRRSIWVDDVAGARQFKWFITAAVVITVANAVADYLVFKGYKISEELGRGSNLTYLKYPIQLLSTICIWGIVYTGFKWTRSEKDLSAAINGFVWGNLICAFVGFYQIISYHLGLPWFDYWYASGAAVGDYVGVDGARASEDFNIFRLSGLGGEPKQAASNFVLALLIMFAIQLGGGIRVRRWRIKAGVLIVALIMTLSTSGILAAIIGFSYFGIVGWRKQARLAVTIGLLVLTVCGVAAVFVSETRSQSVVEDRLWNRFSDGLDSIEQYEPRDVAVIGYARDHPLSLFFGLGAGGEDFRLLDYVNDNWMRYFTPGSVSPAYLPVRILVEFGIVGIFLFVLTVDAWARGLRASGATYGSIFVIGGALTLCFESLVGLSGYLLIASCMAGCYRRRFRTFMRPDPSQLEMAQPREPLERN